MTDYILEIRGLYKFFGKTMVIDNITALIEKGKILSIIGPNGAGKTTLFNLLTNAIPKEKSQTISLKKVTHSGIISEIQTIHPRVIYRPDGKDIDITWKKPYEISRLGIGRTFQGNRVFNNMTVKDNIMLARQLTSIENPLSILKNNHKKLIDAIKKTSQLSSQNSFQETLEGILSSEADYWLDFVGLYDMKDKKAEELSYGQQKLLSLARLLMAGSRLLMLDEPTAGVNPKFTARIAGIFEKVVAGGDKTVLFIEHDMKFIQRLECKCLYLEEGRCPWEFYELDVIMKNPKIRAKFLGM
jgi:ABC-type branched-subunit amino acid transport system ATPase component